MQHRTAVINAQVRAATSSEKQRLTQDAEEHCNLIADHSFWEGLEHIISDIEPICYRTNINQKDSMQADQVLLTLVGMYTHFSNHPILEVADGGHSVQISDSDIDNIVTLYRLRRASGRPADVTWYMCYTGRPNDS